MTTIRPPKNYHLGNDAIREEAARLKNPAPPTSRRGAGPKPTGTNGKPSTTA